MHQSINPGNHARRRAGSLRRYRDHYDAPALVPGVGPDEVLIRIESAGVAQWDPFEREGEFAKLSKTAPTFPYVLGSDGAGTVAAVGQQVKSVKKGDCVYVVEKLNRLIEVGRSRSTSPAHFP